MDGGGYSVVHRWRKEQLFQTVRSCVACVSGNGVSSPCDVHPKHRAWDEFRGGWLEVRWRSGWRVVVMPVAASRGQAPITKETSI